VAYETGVVLPVTSATKEIYRLAMREGHATEDFSAIYEFAIGNHEKEPEAQP
jgi:3-hydroxyisobutyrate dehydrogenase-like beta-hydroxyacid dehydrogenase